MRFFATYFYHHYLFLSSKKEKNIKLIYFVKPPKPTRQPNILACNPAVYNMIHIDMNSYYIIIMASWAFKASWFNAKW